jgi:hypothetical protein
MERPVGPLSEEEIEDLLEENHRIRAQTLILTRLMERLRRAYRARIGPGWRPRIKEITRRG